MSGEARGGKIPGRLCVITDEQLQERFSHVELARLAGEGGAGLVQFREKRLRATAELVRIAREMDGVLRDGRARLVINDRVDVALAAGVNAVHLGRHDLGPELARRILGAEALVGGTANSLEEARRVAAGPVDYLGVGPVYGTRTKTNPAPELGLAALGEIARAVSQPVLAIGNITPERVAEVLEAGAWGVAVVSAVVCAADPARATERFAEAIARWVA